MLTNVSGNYKTDIVVGSFLSQPHLKGCGHKPHKSGESKSTHGNNSNSPVASIPSNCSQINVSNGNNNDDDDEKKRKRSNYVRDSSVKCPLNYEPESDYWSYASSSECSYNHKGEPGFEELKFSDSESE